MKKRLLLWKRLGCQASLDGREDFGNLKHEAQISEQGAESERHLPAASQTGREGLTPGESRLPSA